MSSLEGVQQKTALGPKSRARSGRPARRLLRGLLLATLPMACATGPSDGAADPAGSGGVAGTPGAGGSVDCQEATCEESSCAETGCPVGQTCQPDGECSGGIDGTDLSASGGTNAPGECIDIDVTFEQVVPTVALLIDRSLSMQAFSGFGELVAQEIDAGTYVPWGCPEQEGSPPDAELQANPDWRWNVVRNVLFNPSTGIVSAFADRVRFGMGLYTYQPDVTPDVCPELIQVDFALNNAAELLDTMKCHDIGDKTPTRESLTMVAAALAARDDDDPMAIILATDGAPNSCACPGFGTSALILPECRDTALVQRNGESMSPSEAEKLDLVEAARRIFDETSIRISVIDVSTPDDAELHAHLAAVAAAGGGEIFSGLQPSALSAAFFDLVDGIASCAVDLNGTIQAGKEDQGTVIFDGSPLDAVVAADQDGYAVVSPSRIELLGQPCAELESGDHELSISFPCDAFVVVK